MNRSAALIATIALPLLLAACGDADIAPADTDQTPETGVIEPMADAVLDLQGTGIVLPEQGGFEELAIPFGSARSPAEATIANYVGSATDESEEPDDCGLTFTQYQGVTLHFREDVFVGYWAEAPYIPETTREAFLQQDGIALVEDSTLDHEFTIGDTRTPVISGTFDGDSEDAGIQRLWAGEICLAR